MVMRGAGGLREAEIDGGWGKEIGGKGASGLKDLSEGEWGKYVCLEAATTGKAVKLAPATSWTAGQTFTLLTKSEAEAQLAAAAAAKAKVVATTAK